MSMTKIHKIIILLLIILSVIFLDYKFNTSKNIMDVKNCAYTIQGEKVSLIDGYKKDDFTVTTYFGNKIDGDFNNDKIIDSAFILTQNTGGTGTFFYLAVALNKKNTCEGINAIFLGDRISPQGIEINNGEIVVNYADRRMDEPMVAFTSIGISRSFMVENDILIETTKEDSIKETSCLLYGGRIELSLECEGSSNFKNTCLNDSCLKNQEVKICNCGEGRCFNGKECVDL
mgnify:CR=1 FL=1